MAGKGRAPKTKFLIESTSRPRVILPDPEERARQIERRIGYKKRIEYLENLCLSTIRNFKQDGNIEKESAPEEEEDEETSEDRNIMAKGVKEFRYTPPGKKFFSRDQAGNYFKQDTLDPAVLLADLEYKDFSATRFREVLLMNGVRVNGLNEGQREALCRYCWWLLSAAEDGEVGRACRTLLDRASWQVSLSHLQRVLANWGAPPASASSASTTSRQPHIPSSCLTPLSAPPLPLSHTFPLLLDLLARSLPSYSPSELAHTLLLLSQILLDPDFMFASAQAAPAISYIVQTLLANPQYSEMDVVRCLPEAKTLHFHDAVYLVTCVLPKRKGVKGLAARVGLCYLSYYLGVPAPSQLTVRDVVDVVEGGEEKLWPTVYKAYHLLVLTDFIIAAIGIHSKDSESLVRLKSTLRRVRQKYGNTRASCYFTQVMNLIIAGWGQKDPLPS